ncbi:MAG: flagellar biosynthesis protein FlhF [Gammaproteobacteria bacterium]|nr:flagellar biosynthesis protein FlhF [Gammaproteobacteria bacterium]
MDIKRFLADDVREGMMSVRSLLGPDAVILSNRRVGAKIEILATKEVDAQSIMVGAEAAKKKSRVEVHDFSVDASKTPNVTPVAVKNSDSEKSSSDKSATIKTAQDTSNAKSNAARPNQFTVHEAALLTDQQSVGAGPQQSQLGPRQAAPARVRKQQKEAEDAVNLFKLQQELGALKDMLVGELTRLRRPVYTASNADQQIRDYFAELGLSRRAIDDVAVGIDAVELLKKGSDKETWRTLLCSLGQKLIVQPDELIDQGGVFAVIGASGVGKTTTVAKLAARFALKYGRENVALISTDTLKIGGEDQLQTFGKLLSIPVNVCADSKQLTSALKNAMDKKLVLIDSAGHSQRDIKLNHHLSRIKMHGEYAKNLLIVSATSQTGLADEVMKAYNHAPVHAAILTKADEAIDLGSGLSTLIQEKLSLAYCCKGQGLSDIEVARISSILSTSFAMMRKSKRLNRLQYKEKRIHA